MCLWSPCTGLIFLSISLVTLSSECSAWVLELTLPPGWLDPSLVWILRLLSYQLDSTVEEGRAKIKLAAITSFPFLSSFQSGIYKLSAICREMWWKGKESQLHRVFAKCLAWGKECKEETYIFIKQYTIKITFWALRLEMLMCKEEFISDIIPIIQEITIINILICSIFFLTQIKAILNTLICIMFSKFLHWSPC